MKQLILALVIGGVAGLWHGNAYASCSVPGYKIVGTQSETDHGSMSAGTTCRIDRELPPELTPVVYHRPAHGTLKVTRSYWSYKPAKTFKGKDRFTLGFKGPQGRGHRTIIMAVR